MLAQDATDSFRHVVEYLPTISVRNEGRHIELGIDTLDLFADAPAVLCQIEKRALLSYIQENPSIRTVISARVKIITYLVNGCQLLVIGGYVDILSVGSHHWC